MNKTTWVERLEHWIKTQYGTAGDTQKLKSFIQAELQRQRESIVEIIWNKQKKLLNSMLIVRNNIAAGKPCLTNEQSAQMKWMDDLIETVKFNRDDIIKKVEEV